MRLAQLANDIKHNKRSVPHPPRAVATALHEIGREQATHPTDVNSGFSEWRRSEVTLQFLTHAESSVARALTDVCAVTLGVLHGRGVVSESSRKRTVARGGGCSSVKRRRVLTQITFGFAPICGLTLFGNLCVDKNQHSNGAKCQRVPIAHLQHQPHSGNVWEISVPLAGGHGHGLGRVRIVMVQDCVSLKILVLWKITLASPRLAPHGGRGNEQSGCVGNDRFFAGERAPHRGHSTTLTWWSATRH